MVNRVQDQDYVCDRTGAACNPSPTLVARARGLALRAMIIVGPAAFLIAQTAPRRHGF